MLCSEQNVTIKVKAGWRTQKQGNVGGLLISEGNQLVMLHCLL